MEGATRGRYYVGATRCVQRTGQEGQSQSQDQLSTGGGAGREAQAPKTILLVHLCLLNINRLELFLIGREVDVNKGVILHMGFVNFAEDFAKKIVLGLLASCLRIQTKSNCMQ